MATLTPAQCLPVGCMQGSLFGFHRGISQWILDFDTKHTMQCNITEAYAKCSLLADIFKLNEIAIGGRHHKALSY
jgi:hypothetical protein